MKRVLIPGVILCGADVAQAVDDKNMYMHVFEEMTVYAPVPVPVNGNTHYTSESIERLPTGIWDYVISAIAGRNRYQVIKP